MNLNRSNLEKIGFIEISTFLLEYHIRCSDITIEFDRNSKEVNIIYNEYPNSIEGGEQVYCEIPIYIDTMAEMKSLIKMLEGFYIKKGNDITFFGMTEKEYYKNLKNKL